MQIKLVVVVVVVACSHLFYGHARLFPKTLGMGTGVEWLIILIGNYSFLPYKQQHSCETIRMSQWLQLLDPLKF